MDKSPHPNKDFECSDCGKSFEAKGGRTLHRRFVHEEAALLRPVPFQLGGRYSCWNHAYDSENDFLSVHRLLACVNNDPHDVFAEGTHVHHGPEIEHKWCNWAENVQVMNAGDHSRHHMQVGREELLDNIRRLEDELGRVPTTDELDEDGTFTIATYFQHFDDWKTAVKEAGFEPRGQGERANGPTRTRLLRDLKNVADVVERTPSRSDLDEHGEHSSMCYYRYFDSLTEAVHVAGLEVRDPGQSGRWK